MEVESITNNEINNIANTENDEIIVSQGAEARIYISYFHGKKCIVKERFVKKYRVPELDTKLTKQRILNESRNLAKLFKAGINTPYVLFVDLISRKIYMEYISNGVMMKNILKKIYENQDFSNIYGDLINKIIETLAKDLAKMHNNNVIHGDLTTSNLLMIFDQVDNVEETILNKKDFYSIYFIDFGLSYISPHNEDKAVDLYVLRRAIISSNPKSELIFDKMLQKYQEHANNGKQIVELLIKVEQRGRKKIAFG